MVVVGGRVRVEGMPPELTPRLDPTRPFRWKDGRNAGIPNSAFSSSGYRRLVRGIYVRSSVEVDALVEARTAILVAGRNSFVSHHTAARLYRGIVPDVPVLHASVPPGRARAQNPDVVVHRSRRRPTTFRGVPITTAVDTFLDLAASLSLVDLVVLGDSLVRRGRTSPAALGDAVSAARGRGSRSARTAAGFVRAGVDSPMETRSRMLRVLSGLPELETDVRFYSSTGALMRRLDAGDRPSKTGVEYDGRHHIQREEQWEQDLGRREGFENDEWRIVTLISKDIYTTPGRTIERLRRIFVARGIPVGPPKDDWRRHFPGRG